MLLPEGGGFKVGKIWVDKGMVVKIFLDFNQQERVKKGKKRAKK